MHSFKNLHQAFAAAALLLLAACHGVEAQKSATPPGAQSGEHPLLRADRIAAKLRAGNLDIKGPYAEGLVAVEYNGKRTYIDSNGTVLVPPQFEEASDFRRGFAQVTRGGAWGVIDKNGKDLFPFRADWSYIGEAHDGTMVFADAAGKQGFINTKGGIVVPAVYDDITIFDWSHGVVVVKKGEQSGLIDRQGKVVAPIEYDYMAWFSEGTSRAPVRKDGQWGIINTSGALVHPLSMDYENVSSFYNGLAAVSKDERHGYIDTTGAVALRLAYTKAGPFNKWGHATVGLDDRIVAMIDGKGKIIFKGSYGGAEQLGPDLYRVTSATEPFLSGAVNAAGKIIWPMKYSDITPMGGGLFSVSLEGGETGYYVNEKNEKVAERQ